MFPGKRHETIAIVLNKLDDQNPMLALAEKLVTEGTGAVTMLKQSIEKIQSSNKVNDKYGTS